MTNMKHGTLYIGVTSNLIVRVYQHKNKLLEGFTKRYSLDKLVYYECTSDVNSALIREKQLKKWYRKWKIELIEEFNSEWKDLYDEIGGGEFDGEYLSDNSVD
jgi:putative endonuclease